MDALQAKTGEDDVRANFFLRCTCGWQGFFLQHSFCTATESRKPSTGSFQPQNCFEIPIKIPPENMPTNSRRIVFAFL